MHRPERFRPDIVVTDVQSQPTKCYSQQPGEKWQKNKLQLCEKWRPSLQPERGAAEREAAASESPIIYPGLSFLLLTPHLPRNVL